MRKAFTTADLHEAQRLRAAGLSYAKIGGLLGFCDETIWCNINPEKARKSRVKANARRKHDPAVRDRRRQKDFEYRERLTIRCHQAKMNAARTARRNGHEAIDASVEDMVAAYTGYCFLCGVPEQECTKRLHAEHNHVTGEFRGWACHRCNTVITQVDNNSDLIDKFRTMFPQADLVCDERGVPSQV